MEKVKKLLLPVVIIIILLLPIIINYVNNKKISVISYDKYTSNMSKEKVTLTYFGDTSSEEYAKIKEELLNLKSKYSIEVSAVNTPKLSTEEKQKLTSSNEKFNTKSVFVITQDGNTVKVVDKETENVNLDAQLNKYINNVIPDDEVAYKTVSTYKEFMKIYKSKKVTMHVFGRNTCYYCNIFKPIYNEVAAENNLDIYYYDSDSFNSDEYSKILNSGINIPAECTSSKEEAPLSSGFGTPLTLYFKNGKVVGCISGYVNKEKLETKLKSVGMMK